ncbi:MAG: hypothetical protein WC547_08615 [Candidatus Omnitrophota bacterium]
MLFITVSMLSEARPIIDFKEMKRIPQETRYQIFQNENTYLIVTGVGGTKAMMAVTYLLTRFQAKKTDFLLSFGTCALIRSAEEFKAVRGGIFQAGRIYNLPFQRACYPDLLYRTPFCEADLVTLPSIYRGGAVPGLPFAIRDPIPLLAEMEAAFVYEAANAFLFAHHIFVLRIVSDDGDCDALTKQTVRGLVAEHGGEIASFIEWIEETDAVKQGKSEDKNIEQALLDEIIYSLRLTSCQQNELIRLAGNYLVRKKTFDGIMSAMPKARVKTKREGKEQYERLRQIFLEP